MPFADIIGHERVVEIFRKSIKSGKTSHAYIFEGPAGCGRRKTAMALIQALFCRQAEDDACGVCPSCRKVAGNNHGDIHFLEPLPDKRDISIAQLRDLQRDLALRPYEAPRKACIMEPADRMNLSSANSFLKTLEEPPGNALLILLTENADMLLQTIRSRCQLVRFAPLSSESIMLMLKRNGMDEASAALLSQMANGSMQRAAELDGEALAQRHEVLIKHLATLSLDRISTIFTASEELGGNREETLELLDILLSFARDMIHLSSGCSDIINTTIRPTLEGLVSRLNLERTLQLAEDILETRRSVQRNANVKLALDHLFIRVAGTLA
ncbi:DNA polymerase III subunit delta' [Pelotalea chapellei]|uniref:DNA polymerase III subunit delta' n=1 Tax=Pelotalea chapellei TaxID=44671 RepID=A0ABS5U429_9BACT|nr:DNA polymerase III subunit delta' [Pelotalea chapellei]MBT1070402.1 DNA polymerase III subunit delta' [Pelotalea chapellei]